MANVVCTLVCAAAAKIPLRPWPMDSTNNVTQTTATIVQYRTE